MTRIFISTGEVSGDLQGSLLVESLFQVAAKSHVDLEIFALGGERIAKAGATLLGDTTGIGSVGILESIPYILPTLAVQEKAKNFLRTSPPDIVILIDYLGPNLGIGHYVRRHLPNLPIVWYIAPQEWVWSISGKNTEAILKISDLLLAIFPEEARYFSEKGGQVEWVGHPLIDRLNSAPNREKSRQILGINETQKVVALLPASRQQELKYLMPVMFEAAQILQEQIPDIHFFIPLSRATYREQISRAISQYNLSATLLENQTLEILAAADLAITKSGTVNLEIALLNVPQVVMYRVHPITAWVAENLLKFSIPFMSPANLILMKEIVPELLQKKATSANIVTLSKELLLNPIKREQILRDYQEMRRELGELGVCERAATAVLSMIKS